MFMAPPRKQSSLALSKVPSIKEMCDSLGFETAPSKITNLFTESVHHWRKHFKTPKGIEGSKLLDWSSPEVQEELYNMSMKYLDSGHGKKYWSGPKEWNPEPEFQYPEDSKKLADVLKQLFFKQNKYADNNAKYLEKKPTPEPQSNEFYPSRSQTLDSATSPDLPNRNTTPKVPRTAIHTTPPKPGQPSANKQPGTPTSGSRKTLPLVLKSKNLRRLGKEKAQDIYEGPTEFGDEIDIDNDVVCHNLETYDDVHYIGTKSRLDKSRPSDGADDTEDGPSRKRQKKHLHEELSKRISPRQRIPRCIPGRVIFPNDEDFGIGRSDEHSSGGDDNNDGHGDGEGGAAASRDSTQSSHTPGLREMTYNHHSPYLASSSHGNGFGSTGLMSPRSEAAAPAASMMPPPASITSSANQSFFTSAPSSIDLNPSRSPSSTPTAKMAKARADIIRQIEILSPPPPARSRLEFNIIKARTPLLVIEEWRDGKLKGRSLEATIAAIEDVTQRHGLTTGLKLMLRTSTSERTVSASNEKEWEGKKTQLGQEMRANFALNQNNGQAFEIFIEPLYEDGVVDSAGPEVDFDI